MEKSKPKLAYSIQEAAQLLSISRSFLYELINAGRIRTVKIGTARRIRATDLAEFVKALTD